MRRLKDERNQRLRSHENTTELCPSSAAAERLCSAFIEKLWLKSSKDEECLCFPVKSGCRQHPPEPPQLFIALPDRQHFMGLLSNQRWLFDERRFNQTLLQFPASCILCELTHSSYTYSRRVCTLQVMKGYFRHMVKKIKRNEFLTRNSDSLSILSFIW